MAPVKVAFNGMGRIGRLVFRVAWANPDVYDIVSINDIAAPESIAYLIQYDSIHGTWKCDVSHEEGFITVTDGDRVQKIQITQEKDNAKIDYKSLGCEVVMECTGVFLSTEKCKPYFDAGIKKIVVSAPFKDSGDNIINIVKGCNENLYDPSKHTVVTAASCTTNCLAPLVKVVHENLKIKHGCITTVHAVTNTQTIMDAPNSKKADLRRARSGLMNLAPTSTGSATAITKIFPDLKGKLNGLAVRVPLTNSSLTDAVFEVETATSAEDLNKMLTAAAEGDLKGILRVETQPLVSTDYVNDPASSIVDALSTMVIDGTLVKLYAWYDNEWGYSCRMAEIGEMVLKSL